MVVIYGKKDPTKERLVTGTRDIISSIEEAKAKEKLRQQEFQDAIQRAIIEAAISGKADIDPESPMGRRLGERGVDLTGIEAKRGGYVNIVDPATGEVKTVYTPEGKGDKTYLGAKPPAPKKLTEKDVSIIGGRKEQQAEKEAGYLKGLPGVLERFMPFAGRARQRGIGRRTGELMEPTMRQFEEQFMPQQPVFAGQPQAGLQTTPTFTGQQADPIAQRIAEARADGIPDEQIASDLREMGLDPAQYGL